MLSLTTDTFSGGVLTVNFNGADAVTITSSGGKVLVNGANPTTGAATTGSVTAIDITGTGNFNNTINLSGVSTATGFSNLSTETIATGGEVGGDTVSLGAIKASGAVTVSGSGWISTTLAAGLTAGSLAITPGNTSGTITIDGSITTSGVQDFGAAVTLAGNAVLSAGSGNVTFGSTLNGRYTLTIDSAGTTTFTGVVGGSTALSGLTTDSSGTSVVDASISTSGVQGLTLNDPITLGGNATLSSAAPLGITLGSTVDGAHALTVNAWTVNLEGAIGSSTPLTSVTLIATVNTTFSGGSITTTGELEINNELTLGADATFTAGAAGILVESGIDGAYNTTFNTTGSLTFRSYVGSRADLASLTATAASTTIISVTTTGNQTYNGPVSFEGPTTLNAGSGNVTFNGSINSGGNITIVASGTTTLNGSVGVNGTVSGINIGSGGTTLINGGAIKTLGAAIFSDSVVLQSNTTITASAVELDGPTVDGPGSLTIAQTSGVLSGVFGGTTALPSLMIGGSMQLVGNTSFNVAAGGIGLGPISGSYALSMTTTGSATVAGAIATPTSLSILATGPITLGGNVTTSGNQVYSHPAAVAAGDSLTSTGGSISYISSAPILNPISPFLPPVSTNLPASTPETVATLVGSSILDGNDSYNIAVISQSTPGGNWQYSLDGVNWSDFGAVTGSQSLLLASTDLVQFAPDGTDTGTATFTYRAWNLATGTPGTYVDTSSNGGSTAFSTATDTAAIVIQIPAVVTSDTFADGVLTVNVDGPQNVTISSSGGNVQVNGADPMSGPALASAVTAIDITATSGPYNNVIDLTGVSAAAGFTSLATVAIDTGGSYSSDQVLLGELDASGLVSITGSGNDAVTMPSSLAAGSLNITATSASVNSVTTTGNQVYNASVTLTSNATLSAGSGNVSFDGTVNGKLSSLTVNSSGVTTFGAAVGGSGGLASLTTDAAGSTVVDASITTSSSLTINDPLTLGASITLGGGSSNTVDINNTIDGAYALTFNTGTLVLAGAIGSNTPLASLKVQGTSSSTLGAGSITTTGAQNYTTSQTLAADSTFNAGSAAISIDGLDGPYNVTFNSSGTTTLRGSSGSTAPLASVTTDAVGTTLLDGTVTTSGNQTYNNAVTLFASVASTLQAGSGNITFNSTINDNGTLAIDTTGTTTFNGALGNTSPLQSLTVGAGGTTVLAGGSITTTSTLTFNSSVLLDAALSIANTSGAAIVFNSTVDGDYSLSVGRSGGPAATFAAAVGGSIPLASFSSDNYSLSLTNLTTVGSQTYSDSNVVLDGIEQATGGSITISNGTTLAGNTVLSAGGSVTLNQVNGAYGLNIVSGGVTTLNGWIGPFTAPTSLTVDAAGGETINSIVDTSGNQIYLLPTTLGGGSLSSSSGTVSEVSSINTAPILTPVAPAMPQVVMNQIGTPMTVAAIVDNSITDNNGAYGIAVIGQSATEGSWQYSLDGVDWTNFPAASVTQALLLAANDEVRFLPSGTSIGPATFSYAAWNQTSGTAGTLANTTTNGGNTAFSTATDTASIYVQMISSVTTDTLVGGVLTVNVDGPQGVTISSSGGDVLVNGANPTTGVALASAVTAIDITATAGPYDNVIDLSGVSAATGFTTLATVAVNTGGSYLGDQVKLGLLNASGLVSVTGSGSDAVTMPSGLAAGSVSLAATAISLNSVTTTGNQTYSGPVTLAANTTLSSGSGNITFNGTLDGDYSLTTDSSGITTFGAAVGSVTALATLTTDAAGSTVLDASVTSSGNMTLNNPLTLGGNVTLSAGTNLVTINGTIDGAYALTLDVWNVSLAGAIGSITPLASLTEDVTFDNTFSGNSITTTGNQTYTSDLVLGSNATFNAGSSTISINNLDGAYSATFNTSGTLTLGNVGTSTPLASLTVGAAGVTDFNGNVDTSGNQTYNNSVSLGAFTNVDAGSGNFTFGSTVDGGSLTVNTTGQTTFDGAVGKNSVLSSLTISAGGTTVLAGGSISTTFGITFGSPVVLGSDMTIGTNGFSIVFDGTVDGDYNLTMGSSGLPGTTFSAAVGGVTPLASLTSASTTLSIGNVTTVGAQTYNDQSVQLDGVETSTSGAISINNSVTLLGNSVITAGGAVNLNQVDGASGLNIVSGAVTTLGGKIGSSTPLTSLSVSSTGGEAINANVTTSGNQVYSLPVTVASGVTLTSTAGTVSKISSVGTAPVLTPFGPAFAPVQANSASSAATAIAALVAGSITDNNGSYNIAVTADSSPGGTWQYSLDGVNWTNFPAVSGTQSLLLAAADQVQFVPDGVDTGTATFTYRAWNLSSGMAGALVSTTTSGGNTAFSTATDTASIVVQTDQEITTDTLVGGVLTVNVDGSQNVTVSSSGGNVLVNGFAPTTGAALASAVTAIDITATSGDYDNLIVLTGVSAATGFTSLATVAINTGGSYSSDQVNLGTLNASGLVSITGSGNDAVTTPASLVAGSVSITATAISLSSVTTTGNQAYNGPVTLAANATLSAGSGNVSFNGTVDGAHNLTVDSSGVTTFGGTVGGNTALSSLTTDAAGSIVLDASVTTSGNMTVNDPLTLGANSTISTGTGTLSIANTIDGAYALTIDAWNVSFGGAIGSITPLASLTESVPFTDDFSGGSITTTGPQTFDSNITLGADATFNAGSAEISTNNVNGAYNVTFDTSGLTTLSGNLGNSIALASVTTDAAGTTNLGGDVTTTGNQTYNNPVTLWAFTTLNAGSGNITFNSTVDDGGLTLNTTGTATFNGAVGEANSLNQITVGAGGTTVLAGGSINTTFGITFNSPVVLGSDMVIANAGFSIVFGGTVDGDFNLTIGQSGLPGATFAAAVGGFIPLASLTSDDGTLSLQSVTTVGSQTYNDSAVQLNGILSATDGAISISNSTTLLGNSVVNAGGAVSINQVDGNFALNIVSGALTTLGGKIGQTNPPTSLTVNSADGESILGSVTTSGNQLYTLPVTLASGVKLTSTAGTVSEVPSVNTAPVLTPSATSFAPVVTSQAASTPMTVATLVGNSVTDNNRSYDIAVIGQSTPGGTWQYSLDGTNWTNFGAVSGTQSLLLAASDEVRFAPDGVDTGTATFTYRAWSMITGTAGTLVDTTTNGGNTAFSMATSSASILIQIPAVITADTFSGGVLTVNVDGGQNVTITSSGGDVLVNGANPTTGVALASAVTAINITAAAGAYDNLFDLTGVSNSAGFSSLATVTVNTGGSFADDQVKLGTLNAFGLVSISGSGSDVVTAPSNLVAGGLSIAATEINLNSVTTTGSQIYTGAVTIGSNATISAGSGNVTFNATVDGGYTLAIDSSGVTTFGGTVGGLVALHSLTTDAAGTTVLDASVTTNGSLNINAPLTLGGNVTLGAGVNTVSINSTIDGNYALTINTWNMSLTGAIGSITPLASLTVSVPFTSMFSGGSITTSGAQNYSGLTLDSDTTFDAGSGAINIGGLNGAYNVTLDSTGVTTLSGNIGGGVALASLTTEAVGTTDLTGNVTTSGNQTYNNPVSLGAFSMLNAGSGNVTFNSTVDSGGLTVNTTGTTTFNAAVGGNDWLGSITIGAGGTTILAGGSIHTTFGITFNSPVLLGSNMLISTAGFAINFDSTVDGDFNLTLGQSGFPGTTFASDVGGLIPLASLTAAGNTIFSQSVTTVGSQTYSGGAQLDGVYTTTNGSFTVANATTLLGNSVINAAGAVSLNQVNGKYGLNIVSGATTTLGGSIGNGSPPTGLMVSSTGGEDINANVTTSGNQLYTLPVTLAPGVRLTCTSGSVSEIAALGSAPVLTPIAPVFPPVTVNQPASVPVTVAALVGSSITDVNRSYNIAVTGESTPGGVWQYSLDGLAWTNVGTVSGTQSLLLASSDLLRFAPDAVDTGTATLAYRAWNMASGTAGTYVDTTANGGNSAFSTATDTASIMVQAAQSIITDTFSAGVLTVSVGGSQNITVSSSGGDVLVNGASPTTGVALASAVTAIDITAATGAYNNVIDLTGVSASADFSALVTVTVNTGGSYSTDQVKLGTLNASGLVSITGSSSDAVTATGSLVAGSLLITATTITLGSVTTNGSQTYNGAVTLAGNAIISSGSGNVSFNGTLDGGFNLSIDSAGVTTFGGTVGGSVALNSLTTDAPGTTVLDASATTSGTLTFNDPLTLGGNVTLGAGVNTISINSTINGDYALIINTWNMSLTGAIGSTTPLASLTMSVPFNSTFSGSSITTNGPQTYNTNLTLGSDTTFNAGSGPINIDGLNGAYNVTFDSSGLTTLSGNLGNSIALASVTTDAAGTTDLNGNVTTSGNQTYNNPVSLWAFTTLNAGSGNITFNSTVDSGGLTANTTGTTTFKGAVGKTAALDSLTIGAGGTTVLAGGSINTTFGITFNSPIVLGSDMVIANAGFAIEFEGTVDGDFNLDVGQSGFPGTTFAAAVGGLMPLASLTSAGGTLSLGNVTTVGAQTYNDRTVQLDGIEESTAGAISISNTAVLLGNSVLNAASAVSIGQVNGNFGLNIVSGALTTLGGSIGQATPLTSLTVSSASGEDINANVTTSGNQIYTLPVVVATGVNLTSTGGTVTDSPAVDTAPVLTPMAPTLAPILVNQGTISAVPVSTLVGNSITDDNHAYQIAVVGQSNAAGNWEYSLDGGTTWTNFGSVSVSQALLLNSNDLVQFVPLAGNTQTATFTYRAWNQSTGTPGALANTSSNGGDTAFSTATDTASVTVDPAPTVVGLYVSGSSWSQSYLNELDSLGLGAVAVTGATDQGYSLPSGADQYTALPWVNLDTLRIAFDENVTITQAALTLEGVNSEPSIASFSYDSSDFTATWVFSAPLALNANLINLNNTLVTGDAGVALDGLWTDQTSTFAAQGGTGSGNGAAGSDFNFGFYTLPGDVKGVGTVLSSAAVALRNALGTSIGDAGYNYLDDVKGVGTILSSAAVAVRNDLGNSIGGLSVPAAPLNPDTISVSSPLTSGSVMTSDSNATGGSDAADDSPANNVIVVTAAPAVYPIASAPAGAASPDLIIQTVVSGGSPLANSPPAAVEDSTVALATTATTTVAGSGLPVAGSVALTSLTVPAGPAAPVAIAPAASDAAISVLDPTVDAATVATAWEPPSVAIGAISAAIAPKAAASSSSAAGPDVFDVFDDPADSAGWLSPALVPLATIAPPTSNNSAVPSGPASVASLAAAVLTPDLAAHVFANEDFAPIRWRPLGQTRQSNYLAVAKPGGSN